MLAAPRMSSDTDGGRPRFGSWVTIIAHNTSPIASDLKIAVSMLVREC